MVASLLITTAAGKEALAAAGAPVSPQDLEDRTPPTAAQLIL
jgi:hypothetical protein